MKTGFFPMKKCLGISPVSFLCILFFGITVDARMLKIFGFNFVQASKSSESMNLTLIFCNLKTAKKTLIFCNLKKLKKHGFNFFCKLKNLKKHESNISQV